MARKPVKKKAARPAPEEEDAPQAPPAPRAKFLEWSPKVWGLVGTALACTVVGLILGWSAFVRWRTKANVQSGYLYAASGRSAEAKVALKTVLDSWDPSHEGSRELYAKLLCDEGKLGEARREYDRLVASAGEPRHHAGLGVVALKEADQASTQAEAVKKAGEAREHFAKAKGIPEGDIGLGHCELLLARRTGEEKHLSAARTIFQRVKKSLEGGDAARVTRDGLMDYYAGLGLTLGGADAYNPEASQAFRVCMQLGDQWALPAVNLMRVETRRLRDATLSPVELKKDSSALELLNTMSGRVRAARGADREKLEDAWNHYALALARAIGRAGDVSQYTTIFRKVPSASLLAKGPFLTTFDAQFWSETVSVREVPAAVLQRAISSMIRSCEACARMAASKGEDLNALQAAALNNQAWAECVKAVRGGGQSRRYTGAWTNLKKAALLLPDDYVINRNLVVVGRRMKRPEAEYSGHLEKARAAAQGDYARDFAELSKGSASE